MRVLRVLIAIGILALGSLPKDAFADDYPKKPIKIVVGIGAGGITDVATRLYAQAVSKRIGQSIVIENRPGGGGSIAASAVQSAEPDGYTLLSFYGSQMATVSAMHNLGFDPVAGYEPITFLCENIMFLTVPAESSVNSVSELFDPSRKKSAELVFGTPGLGTPSHLLGERIARANKAPIRVAHYRGGPAMMTDLLAERIDFTLPSYTLALPFINSNKVKVLAVDTQARLLAFPQVATLDNLGLGAQRVASWIGLAAPAGTHPAIIKKLNEEFGQAARDQELSKRMEQIGTPIRTSSPDEMRNQLKSEMGSMATLVRELGLHK